MLDKIAVKDSYNLVPGLFDHSGFVKSHSPQVEILPTQCYESFQHSHCLTVFVDSEPDIHCAHEHFAQQQQSRPNNVWAVSATSPSVKYQFDTVVEYWSNLVFTVIKINWPMCCWEGTCPTEPKFLKSCRIHSCWIVAWSIINREPINTIFSTAIELRY